MRKAIIMDLDGTLCNNVVRAATSSDDPLDYEELYKNIPNDKPNEWAQEIVRRFRNDHTILYLTGRPEHTRPATLDWLRIYMEENTPILIMREPGDFRPDYDVKAERLDAIVEVYDVLFAVDDRQGPRKAYLEHNIPCLYVGDL